MARRSTLLYKLLKQSQTSSNVMQLLTQRNATIAFGVVAAWTSVHAAYPTLVTPRVEEVINAACMAVGTFLIFIGFTRTPAGNQLPPGAVHQIDQQATLARASDAVVELVAQKVTEEAKKP